MKEKVGSLQNEVVEHSGLHCHLVLNSLKFHLLEYNEGDLEQFEMLSVLKNFTDQHYSWHITSAHRSISRRR